MASPSRKADVALFSFAEQTEKRSWSGAPQPQQKIDEIVRAHGSSPALRGILALLPPNLWFARPKAGGRFSGSRGFFRWEGDS